MTLTRSLDRRTFLRASGVALALPMLESMTPTVAHAAATGPRRMVNICNTLGLYREAWFPKTAGAGYETTEYLSLLEKHRSELHSVHGLLARGPDGTAAAQLGGHVPDRRKTPRP